MKSEKTLFIEYLVDLTKKKPYVILSKEDLPKNIRRTYCCGNVGNTLRSYEAYSKGLMCFLDNIDSGKKTLIVFHKDNEKIMEKGLEESKTKYQEYLLLKKQLEQKKNQIRNFWKKSPTPSV